jgi:DNA-directed RNA polymerase specialized sigma24 family protein
MRPSRRHTPTRIESSSSVVVPFPVPGSDVGLVTALRAGHVDAARVLCERHSGYLVRVAARILGPDQTLVTVVAEALHDSLETLEQLKDPRALRVWLVSRLVVAARQRLKARRRWRWLGLQRHSEASCNGERWSEQLLASYRVLDRLSDEQRIVFCLVIIHSMGLADVATALGFSLSQVRGALDKACDGFVRHSECEPTVCVRRLRSA